MSKPEKRSVAQTNQSSFGRTFHGNTKENLPLFITGTYGLSSRP